MLFIRYLIVGLDHITAIASKRKRKREKSIIPHHQQVCAIPAQRTSSHVITYNSSVANCQFHTATTMMAQILLGD